MKPFILHPFWTLVLLIAAISTASPALAQPDEPEKMNRMVHGPFVTSTITEDPLTSSGILTDKGIAVQVGTENAPATMAFDTDLLRVAAAWSGGFLHWYPARTSLEQFPTPDGFVQFSTGQGPGWTPTGNFEDPRTWPHGPVPEDWGRYRGLYLRGDTVVFSYAVGETEILEMPAFGRSQDRPVFTRTFRLESGDEELSLRVLQAPEGRAAALRRTMTGSYGGYVQISSGTENRLVGFQGITDAAAWSLEDHHLVLHLPPRDRPLEFAVHVGPITSSSETAFMEAHLHEAAAIPDLRELRRPGPSRWETIETKARPGDRHGPFVVDDLTLPVPNPWHSYLRLSGVDFLSDGRAVVSSLSGDIWLVSGLSDTLGTLQWQRFATGLYQPLGVRVVDDTIYVTGRDQITRLHDRNGDREADFYENFNNEVMAGTNFHAFTENLETDSAGNFYFSKSTPWPLYIPGAGPPRTAEIVPHHGALFRVPPDGSELEIVATGLRNPNGLAISPDDEIVYADNQGNWVPTSNVQRIDEGGFHGFKPSAHGVEIPEKPIEPIVWIPHYVDNSPGSPIWMTSGQWPDDLRGSLLLTSYGKATLSLILTEEVEGVMQGGLLTLPLEFDSGIMRGRFHADGHLYVAGMTSWQSAGRQAGSFHRVRYAGGPHHLPVSLNTASNGLRLGFSQPLDPEEATRLSNYHIEQWNYRWTRSYGSSRYSVKQPTRVGTDTVEIASINLSSDRKSVFLEIPEIRPVMGMSIDYTLRAADGSQMGQVIYNTINRVPTGGEER